MKTVFADAGYWIATVDEDDTLHFQAVALARSVPAWKIVTTEMVLTELLNHVADFGPVYRQKAALLVRALRQNPAIRVLPLTEDLFETALIRYERFQDKQWGLTDCVSFVVMEASRPHRRPRLRPPLPAGGISRSPARRIALSSTFNSTDRDLHPKALTSLQECLDRSKFLNLLFPKHDWDVS